VHLEIEEVPRALDEAQGGRRRNDRQNEAW